MLETILLASSLLFCGTQAIQGDDMDDSDFEAFIWAHHTIVTTHWESAAKGCISGGIGGTPGGFSGLCLGCALGAAGNVAQDIVFSEKVDNALRRY